ncbi:MAG: Holliday junction resolvase RuvX [Actinobacteria bacterium]|nr:Holliday junction resolvase RuvX [Actinomycetota bacterium]
MRILGLDIGDRRVGVALGDSRSRIATPLEVLAAPLSRDLAPLHAIIDEYSIAMLVVGLPLTMSGEEGPQAKAVRAEVEILARHLPVDIVFQDERLSSAQANRQMGACGVSAKKRRGSVDMVAAAIVLQTYFNSLDCT